MAFYETIKYMSQYEVEVCICRHLGLPEPEEPKKGILKKLLGKS